MRRNVEVDGIAIIMPGAFLTRLLFQQLLLHIDGPPIGFGGVGIYSVPHILKLDLRFGDAGGVGDQKVSFTGVSGPLQAVHQCWRDWDITAGGPAFQSLSQNRLVVLPMQSAGRS